MICEPEHRPDNARFGQTARRSGSFDALRRLYMARIVARRRPRDLVPLPPVRREAALEMGLVNCVRALRALERDGAVCREMLANSPIALRCLRRR